MEPIDLTNLFLTCKTIVDSEIKGHCDAIIEKINALTSLANKKGQKKNLKKLKKKVKKIRKVSTNNSKGIM